MELGAGKIALEWNCYYSTSEALNPLGLLVLSEGRRRCAGNFLSRWIRGMAFMVGFRWDCRTGGLWSNQWQHETRHYTSERSQQICAAFSTYNNPSTFCIASLGRRLVQCDAMQSDLRGWLAGWVRAGVWDGEMKTR